MKHDTPVTDRRAAYLQDAADLERTADELEARGQARDALHLRMEAEQVRAEAPPHYTVERSEYSGLWLIFEDGADIACLEGEEKARFLADSANRAAGASSAAGLIADAEGLDFEARRSEVAGFYRDAMELRAEAQDIRDAAEGLRDEATELGS